MLHQRYRCRNWNDIDKAINMIMKTDVGTEIELDLKPENIGNTENDKSGKMMPIVCLLFTKLAPTSKENKARKLTKKFR